jgi:acetyl esterase/lipase
MRVVSLPSLRIVVIAATLVAAFLATGCTAQATSVVRHSLHHSIVRHTQTTAELVTVLPDLTYGVAAGVPLRLDICTPVTRAGIAIALRPAIIAIHGGSWMEGDKAEPQWRDICTWLASEGYVAATVDYRLAPKYRYPDELRDVEQAVEWMRAPAQVRRYGIDPALIGAFGGSAGGNLAALLGTIGTGALDTGHRVAAVTELSGPADLTVNGAEAPLIDERELSYLGCQSLRACPQDVPASPIDNVNSSDPPFLILHSQDELIPLSQSLRFAARLRAAGVHVTLDVVPGSLHSISMLTPSLRATIIDFFRSTLVHHAPASETS